MKKNPICNIKSSVVNLLRNLVLVTALVSILCLIIVNVILFAMDNISNLTLLLIIDAIILVFDIALALFVVYVPADCVLIQRRNEYVTRTLTCADRFALVNPFKKTSIVRVGQTENTITTACVDTELGKVDVEISLLWEVENYNEAVNVETGMLKYFDRKVSSYLAKIKKEFVGSEINLGQPSTYKQKLEQLKAEANAELNQIGVVVYQVNIKEAPAVKEKPLTGVSLLNAREEARVFFMEESANLSDRFVGSISLDGNERLAKNENFSDEEMEFLLGGVKTMNYLSTVLDDTKQ